MRCECFGEVMTYRIATEPGHIHCSDSGARCPYKAGDYILTLTNPLTGNTCDSILDATMFKHACKVIA
jgi:hypothetical protein